MLDVLIEDRIKKVSEYRKNFGNPYPAKSASGRVFVADFLKKFKTKIGKSIIAGRILAFRNQGKIIFMDIADFSGKVQVVLQEKKTKQFEKTENLDTGDIIEVAGKPFTTKKGERSILGHSFRILAKCIRPWPSQWYGLEDVEARSRERYLDLIFHPEARSKLELRSKIIAEMRTIFSKEGFLEVETPILQPLPGGAIARPFSTHFNALNIDVFLRVAPELYLKRLLVAGFEKIFEIGKDFRNEGIDRDHYPEFTMLELYKAHEDYEGMMKSVERWLKTLARRLKISSASFAGKPIKKFYKKWPRVDYAELIKKWSGKSLRSMKTEEVDEIFKKKVRPNIIDPIFVVKYPKAISPLAKSSEKDSDIVDRFQLVVAGTELVNGFSELNDPFDQRERMEVQEKMRQGGDEEASRLDEDFLRALEYGMPPSSGIGIGIDRLAAFLSGSASLREVVAFTNLKPKETQ